MKRSVIAACLAGGVLLTSCSHGDGDFLANKYDYDLSEYIDLAEYKNVAANGYEYSVTDADVATERAMVLAYYSKEVDVKNRGAELGDVLYIDYTASVDGVYFEEGSGTDVKCTLGYEKFLFEDVLYGVSAGSVLSADCTYPEEYEAYPEYAGKEVHYDIKVDSVKRLELPNYTDDFARAYLNAESIEDYENKLRANLQKDYDKNHYNYILSQVWNTVYSDTVVKEYPEHEIDTLCDDMIESNKAYAASSGVQFSTYLGVYYEMTEEEFYEYVREEAETRVKQEMICYAIARAENIEITDEVYKERATVYAVEDYGYKTLAEFESVYSKETIYHSILCDLVFELIVENADITITENTFG